MLLLLLLQLSASFLLLRCLSPLPYQTVLLKVCAHLAASFLVRFSIFPGAI